MSKSPAEPAFKLKVSTLPEWNKERKVSEKLKWSKPPYTYTGIPENEMYNYLNLEE